MCSRITTYGLKYFATVGLLTFVFAGGVFAQDSSGNYPEAQSSPTPQASTSESLEHTFLKNILSDQRAIWTGPLSQRSVGGKCDWLWHWALRLSNSS